MGMVLVILLIVVLALILVSLYSEIKIYKIFDDETDELNHSIVNIANLNSRLEKRVRELEKDVDGLMAQVRHDRQPEAAEGSEKDV